MVALNNDAVMTDSPMSLGAIYHSSAPAAIRPTRPSLAALTPPDGMLLERLRRAREAAAIEGEDILAQADEAAGLS